MDGFASLVSPARMDNIALFGREMLEKSCGISAPAG
jgi:hypothetical protein